MALDPRYITAISLDSPILDKDTGAPLAGGTVQYWEDNDRTVPKLVYQLTGAPPNYTYTALPDPITLSSKGTPMDASGNDIAVYGFPYDEDGNIQLYYIAVFNSLGVEQFTREGWPNLTDATNPNETQANISNALSNSQFVDVAFNPNMTYTINVSGSATTTVPIATDWNLIISNLSTGVVTVTRNLIAGSADLPFNPPYTLTINSSGSISGLQLAQRLYHNPNIWSPDINGLNGYIAASILLAPGTSVTMSYAPSSGTTQTLLSELNSTGLYTQFNNTVQLIAPDNSQSSDVGYVDIILNLPSTGVSTFGNVQVVGLENDNINVVYDQQPVNRQEDYLFHHYNPLLQYKPIPSYLTGWSFAQNPTQIFGPTVTASSAGANTSAYVWDQTIVFQSVDSGAAADRDASGGLIITATNATQFALIQYLPQDLARKVLNDAIAVNVAAITNAPGGLSGKVSLWYTTSTLPSTGSNNSIVATLDATGLPATLNGTWTQVPRSLGDAQFTVESSPNTTNFNDYGFFGWNMNGIAACNTATFVAIVVGFATLPVSDTITFDSISLCSGSIPTRPAPKTDAEVLLDCQQYFVSTFLPGTAPAQNVGNNTGEYTFTSNSAVAANNPYYGASKIVFPTFMNVIPTITVYSPGATANLLYNETHTFVYTTTTISNLNLNGFLISGLNALDVTNTGDTVGFHYTADARLGK